MQGQITQLHLEILALCFAVKAKGHDAFYSYAAHVNWVDVRVYLNGWKLNGGQEDVSFKYLPTLEADFAIKNLTECKTYLEGLMG